MQQRITETPHRLVPVDAAEALRLLGSVALGRIVFTQRALPAIRPVNHIVRDGLIIIRTEIGTTISNATRSADGIVVAYEADDLDPEQRTGWSVVATGVARQVGEPARIEEYAAVLHPWIERTPDRFIAVDPQIITGFRLEE